MKTFTIPITESPDKYAPCNATMIWLMFPIEDHPKLSKPDIRFRHERERKKYRALKASGIKSIAVSAWRIEPINPH